MLLWLELDDEDEDESEDERCLGEDNPEEDAEDMGDSRSASARWS